MEEAFAAEPTPSPHPAARTWLGLAVSSLVVAGALALVLVVGRLPGLAGLFSDPLIFKRGLVVHVCLSLVAWLCCFLVSLFLLLPGERGSSAGALPGATLSALGMGAMVLGAGVPGATPVLANYIPVLDTGLYLGGLALLFGGVAVALAGRRLLPGADEREGGLVPPEARPWLRGAAVLVLVALVTFLAAGAVTISGLPTETWYELVAWGGGHVLQAANAAAMVSVWLMLLRSALSRPVLPAGASALLAGAFVLPQLAAPAIALSGTSGSLYREGLTALMRWGIFPAVTVVALLGLHALYAARRAGGLPARGLGDPRLLGFFASLGLTTLGFVLGALIRGSNTMVPGHYHAAIGGVTASFMAATWLLARPLGLTLDTPRAARLSRWQVVIYGGGQALFALGFALAGAHGMARKTYGQEQQIRSLGETLGLGLMGAGGVIAIVGGLIFLSLVIAAWRARGVSSPAPLPPLFTTGGSRGPIS